MVYKVIVDPVAILYITESIEWYNKAQAGLGIKFYKQVQAILKTIRKNPFIFALRYKTCAETLKVLKTLRVLLNN